MKCQEKFTRALKNLRRPRRPPHHLLIEIPCLLLHKGEVYLLMNPNQLMIPRQMLPINKMIKKITLSVLLP